MPLLWQGCVRSIFRLKSGVASMPNCWIVACRLRSARGDAVSGIEAIAGADDRGRAILLEYREYLMRYPLSEAA